MAQRNFFISSWINHVVESETSEWKLMEKLSEKNDQESKEQWEDEGTYEPMEAMALFRCVNPSEPNKLAYMKIFMQIPYVGSEIETHDVRRKQASDKLGSFAYNEREALVNLTKSDCRSTPLLLAWKQEKQDNSGLVPGEFLLYLVTDELPGDRLDRDKYWKSSPQERDDVREAFKVAWSDSVRCGTKVYEYSTTNLLWDRDNNANLHCWLHL